MLIFSPTKVCVERHNETENAQIIPFVNKKEAAPLLHLVGRLHKACQAITPDASNSVYYDALISTGLTERNFPETNSHATRFCYKTAISLLDPP